MPFVRSSKPLGVATTAALIAPRRLDDDGYRSGPRGGRAGHANRHPAIGGDPGRFFPWPGATKSIVLNKPMSCEGCHNRCTLAEAECITQIPPADVVIAFAKLCGTRGSRVEVSASAAKWLKVAG